MQVTSKSSTELGVRYELDNGDALLLKESETCKGRTTSYPVYLFASGLSYSARTGRHSATTIIPAVCAMNRFEAKQKRLCTQDR